MTRTANEAFERSLSSMRLAAMYEALPDDPAADHVVAAAAVLRAYRILTGRVEAVLAEHGLSMARFEVLGLLATAPDGRLGLTELKKVTLLPPATMTHTIGALEHRGLINRVRDIGDRRVVFAEITPEGVDVAARARASLTDIHFGLQELDEADARRLCVSLSVLRRSS